MSKLLVSIRGPLEALEAAKGGAHFADVEYPASALGTPYPLNILDVKNRLADNDFDNVGVTTNIGETQNDRASACQSAVGVATAGADVVKCGLGELNLEPATYLGDTLVRSVKKFEHSTKVIPTVFVDEEMVRFLDPFEQGLELTKEIGADGLLIDTFNKAIGKGLLDYCSPAQIEELTESFHDEDLELWIAGSINRDEMSELWDTGVDVICVRGAACEQTGGSGRFGEVKKEIVQGLVETLNE